ncbi:DUF1192 domain-containing protein [Haloarcula sp. JP-Z28]|uniref:DUF1192 domain-containing protein n=1 Tax=Haloarcula sp. JP-Z28 TaxID=2716715 RepID=UPI0014054735|nr:DUF1192 domain-containing protein [Haloarcula sp. JP-Z28]NHN65259.1 DUF1192 domain-containing protein [Haloarcula sp. JP-Z28]
MSVKELEQRIERLEQRIERLESELAIDSEFADSDSERESDGPFDLRRHTK